MSLVFVFILPLEQIDVTLVVGSNEHAFTKGIAEVCLFQYTYQNITMKIRVVLFGVPYT